MNLWKAKCHRCGSSRSLIVEDGQSCCPSHTKASLRARALEDEAKEKRKKDREKSVEARSMKWFESLSRKAKKRVPHIIVNQRPRPWDMCRRCRLPTESKEKEQDPEKRYCMSHMPARVAIMLAEVREAKMKKGVCKVNRANFKGCKALEGTWLLACSRLPNICVMNTHVCFDLERKWRISRARCRVRPLPPRGETPNTVLARGPLSRFFVGSETRDP